MTVCDHEIIRPDTVEHTAEHDSELLINIQWSSLGTLILGSKVLSSQNVQLDASKDGIIHSYDFIWFPI